MYIESSGGGGYGKKWSSRSHTTTAYCTDNSSHWSGVSVKNKTRKPLVNQPLSISNLSPCNPLQQRQLHHQEPSQLQQQHFNYRSLNGSVTPNDQYYPLLKHATSLGCTGINSGRGGGVGGHDWTNDSQSKSISEMQTVQTSPDLYNLPQMTHLSTGNPIITATSTAVITTAVVPALPVITHTTGQDISSGIIDSNSTSNNNNNNNMHHNNGLFYHHTTKEPQILSKEIAQRVRDRFNQRVLLKHMAKSKQYSYSHGRWQYTPQYHLLAVFLVNKGSVEAWYAYAPMPNIYTSQQEPTEHTRVLELTQRRLRLLQRYYSEGRQYVVLYVNNNRSEHYLPIGLASDPNQKGSCKQYTNKNHSLSTCDELMKDGNRFFCRLFNSILPDNLKLTSNASITTNKDMSSKSKNTKNDGDATNDKKISEQTREQKTNYPSEEQQNKETEQLVQQTGITVRKSNFMQKILGHLIPSNHKNNDNDNNNNNNSNDKENYTNCIDQKIDLNCYKACLPYDGCFVKSSPHQPQNNPTGKMDTPISAMTTVVTTGISITVTPTTCMNDPSECSLLPLSKGDERFNRKRSSNKNRKYEDNGDNDHPNDDGGDENHVDDERRSTVETQQSNNNKTTFSTNNHDRGKIQQTEKLSDSEEIWLPKSFDL
ncbi:unnamed protein product [Trichobilharzia szidati]|nr:unnamed protein product [Trichobilharzia szidati]